MPQNKPVFIYFGIAGFISLLTTIYLGFNISKFGFKKHKFMALFSTIIILTHIILAIIYL